MILPVYAVLTPARLSLDVTQYNYKLPKKHNGDMDLKREGAWG